jgi:DnaK suppressor protein
MNAAIDQLDVAEARMRLTTVRDENEADLVAAQETLARLADDGSVGAGNMSDVLASAQHMVGDAQHILAEVAAAFVRIDDGTYGSCASCGGPIAVGRLEVRPYVRTCLACSA